jgi:peptidyl-prolyl cis-trans isomerase A (cyclophilin A)
MRPILFLCIAAIALAQSPELKPGLYATFDTSKGRIVALLYEKDTPKSVKNFVGLAQGTVAWKDPKTGAMVKRPFYEHMIFHRTLPGIMIQAGDPTGTGSNHCGAGVPDEFLPGLLFDRPGRLAVANTGQPNSGECQFFITEEAMREWNGQYTIFGQVVSGQDVVHQINRATERALLNSVTIERIAKTKR